MKNSLTLLFAACAVIAVGTIALSTPTVAAPAAAATEGWGSNYQKATAQAKAEKKLLLLNFTGSDWCPFCIQLGKEVFSQPEFKKYAAQNLVLLDVDFPLTHLQPAALKTQNDMLQNRYGIETFPTVVVLNPAGKKIGEIGYQPGGPKAFIAALEHLKK